METTLDPRSPTQTINNACYNVQNGGQDCYFQILTILSNRIIMMIMNYQVRASQAQLLPHLNLLIPNKALSSEAGEASTLDQVNADWSEIAKETGAASGLSANLNDDSRYSESST